MLVVRHARVEARIAWLDALRLVNERGVARIDRAWDRLPPADPPPGVVVDGHPYAADLDLFGRASLYQLLGPAATALGGAPAGRMAAGRLAAGRGPAASGRGGGTHPADGVARAFRRPRYRRVTRPLDDVERFLAWAEGEPFLGRHGGLVHATVLALTAAIWILFALLRGQLTASAFWMVPVAIGIVLSFVLARTGRELAGSCGRRSECARAIRPAARARRARAAKRTATRRASQRLTAEGRQAPACMRRLKRILGFGELRRGAAIMHFPIQALTLWDFHVVFALERWRRAAGPRVRGWLDALARARCAVGAGRASARDNPQWSGPPSSASAGHRRPPRSGIR